MALSKMIVSISTSTTMTFYITILSITVQKGDTLYNLNVMLLASAMLDFSNEFNSLLRQMVKNKKETKVLVLNIVSLNTMGYWIRL